MAQRKIGNPEGAGGEPIPISIPRGGDWIDTYEGGGSKAEPPKQDQAPVAATLPPVSPPLAEVELKPQAPPAPAEPAKAEVQPEVSSVGPAKKPARKVRKPSASKPKADPKPAGGGSKTKKTKRPRQRMIGYPLAVAEAADKLQALVVAQSEETLANHSDVIGQATCAVARAIDSIQCKSVPARGHHAAPTAAVFNKALEDAFYRGVAISFIENHVDRLPDHILELCYAHYRQRNSLDDDYSLHPQGGSR